MQGVHNLEENCQPLLWTQQTLYLGRVTILISFENHIKEVICGLWNIQPLGQAKVNISVVFAVAQCICGVLCEWLYSGSHDPI